MGSDQANVFPQVDEVFLPRAPLIVVLAQVRFESILSIQTQANLAPFQDAIRGEYPVFRPEKGQTTTINPATKSINISRHNIWRFSDLDEKWKVSLAPTFIALQTTEYKTKDEYLKRFERVLTALTDHFNPGVVTRTGIRYIDRLTDDALGSIKTLVKPALLGVLVSDQEKNLSATSSEALFQLDPYRLLARWGSLPPNATTDPALIKPEKKPSWVLDIDVSHTSQRAWNKADLLSEFKQLSDVSYRFFRWAVTDDFLTHFGGKP